MSKDYDNPDIKRQKADDWADYNHALAGVEAGRISVHHVQRQQLDEDEKRKKKEQNELLLTLVEEYRHKFEIVFNKMIEVQTLVYTQMIEAQELQNNEAERLQDMLSRASTLSDGTAFFFAKGGAAYTQDGQNVVEDDLALATFNPASVSWEGYQAQAEKVEQARLALENLQRIDQEVHQYADELEDLRDNPTESNLQRLHEFDEKIDAIKSQLTSGYATDHELVVSAPASLPELKF